MRTFFWYLVFVVLINFIGFEMFRQLENDFNPDQTIVIPVELEGESLYTPKVYTVDDPEVICLAENIFYEARGEGETGKRAIALVTLNRVNHRNYSDTVCGVVNEPYQFSWTHQGMKIDLNNPIERRSWEASKKIALKALNKVYINDMLGVTHYHATSVKPKWGLPQVAQIGKHIFYTGN